jgi:small-conductance mechanosensitive channel
MTVRQLLLQLAEFRFLRHEFLGNPVAAWAVAVAIALGTFAALVFVRRLLVRRLERTAATTHTIADDLALDGLRRTRRVFLLAIATVAGALALELPEARRTLVEKVATLAFLFQAASWGNGAISFWLAQVLRARAQTDRASVTTLNLLGVIARIVLFVLLVLLALQAFGVNVTALITGLGIAGVAVALAVQNVLGDLLASLSIALDKPFVVGDFIIVDTFMGTVEDVGLKTTRLRALSGEQLIFSNNELLKARIRNMGRMRERRVLFTLSVEYGTPPDVMARIPAMIREVVTAEPMTRFDRSHFSAFGDSALLVETVYYFLSAEYNAHMDAQQRIYVAILQRFQAEGIAFAFPTRSVVVRDGEGAAAGDGAPGVGALRRAIAAAGGVDDLPPPPRP